MLVRRAIFAYSVVALIPLFVAACGGGGDSTEPNDPVASVTVAPTTAQLTSIGETAQLAASVRTQGGATANASVTWQSSAPQVATVDANGLVRAVSNGSAQITATSGTVSGSASVTVQQIATRVNLTPGRDSIFAGATLQLTAAATDRSNAAITAPRATWASNDTTIAVVSSTGLVTGRKRGEARITARVDTASAGMDIIIRLTSILASRDTVITGPLQVDRFEVAAGRTVTLAGDFALRAEGPVVISGTIRGDCRGVDIVSLATVTLRGRIDNTCTVASAPGKSLRVVSGTEYVLESATVSSSGGITITNDTTLNVDAPSLGSPRRVAPSARAAAQAPCTLNGAIGLGRTRPDGASGNPRGSDGVSPPLVALVCQGDLTVRGLTVKADHGGDGGEATSTVAGVPARAGNAGDGGRIGVASFTKVIFDGAQLTAGNGGRGGDASSSPTTPGPAEAIASDGGAPGIVFVRTPQIVFQGSFSRIEEGVGGNGGDAFAVALNGADATPAQAAQPGSEARARGGIGGGDRFTFRRNVIGDILAGQVQNAASLLIRASVGGKGGDAEVSPGNGGNSNVLTYPHGANGGDGRIFVGIGGDARLFDNRGSGAALGTPGGTGNGVIRNGNGGFGIPDCVLPVYHLGGDGGSGSKVELTPIRPGRDALDREAFFGTVQVVDALNGRDGRDGIPPGSGGLAGELTSPFAPGIPVVDIGTSRKPGRTGLRCPPTTSTNPICDAQLTPQASVIRQISQHVFAGNPFAFCANATTNLSTAPVIHTIPGIAPMARAANHTSFNIVGGGTYPLTPGNAAALNTMYPCGQHANGLTHCVQNNPLTAGPHVVAFGVMNGNIPQADPANFYQYGFVFDSDNNPANNYTPTPQFANDFFKGTDRWYQAQYNPRSAGFNFSATRVLNNTFQTSPTNGRLILSGATWMLIVPGSEFVAQNPMVRFTAFRHTGNFGQTGDWNGDVQLPVDQPLWTLPIQPTPPPPSATTRMNGRLGLNQ